MKHSLPLGSLFLLTALPTLGQGLSNQGAVISIQSGAQLAVVGDVTVSNGGTIDNAGTLSLTGNWTNNTTGGVLTPATGTVQLVGTTTQQIGGTGTTTFHTLDVSGATSAAQLTADISVGNSSGLLTLGANKLQLNTHVLTLNNGATSAISRTTGSLVSETNSTAGYGRLNWVIGSNTGTYTVPLSSGTTDVPMTANITAGGNSSGGLSFATYSTGPDNLPLPTGVTSLRGNSIYALDRYWIVQTNNYTLAPTSTLTFGYLTSEFNTAPNNITEGRLRLQRWNGSAWESPQGNVSVPNNTLTSDLQNTYGIFTGADQNNPLPVELREFTAQAKETDAVLSWTTASELNNEGFFVEVSVDSKTFQRVGFVAGKGTTNIAQQYRFTDVGAARRGSLQYYRLRQHDTAEGTDTYSPVRTVSFTQSKLAASLSAFPNPTDRAYTVRLTAAKAQTVQLTMYDALGRIVSQAPVALQAGENQLPTAFEASQPVGVYLLTAVIDGQVLRARLVRE
ncbi:T9SS type A sorting domain-containing protein [Hymenobacter chitinivorans]|uniref:Putative secreted protein (Por secretion system target) n=1 Tax=Hymenobacter chitinivorans DSM 11115 TaxID=1121954 RepID=A0A2M9B4M3_9BACT|nr:T9SS type A sorting domain-containing protein [Hymenobacter chitinivorans]PJJ52877.1 putative secreted protein (Por secretion system target) [Hymenobacter chitinivorans DSM 11115]